MLIQNYGLHWDWEHGMKGRDKRGSLVDFSGVQVGIYVLHYRRAPIYVGRSGEGRNPCISGRLVDHHRSRDWDTFSWFGFFPVVDGIIERRSEINTTVSEAISDIEALAIYLLQDIGENGVSGKHKHIDQYIQQVGAG